MNERFCASSLTVLLHSPDHSIATERRVLPYRDEWVREMLWMGSALQGSQNDRAPPRTYSRRRCPSLALFGRGGSALRCPFPGEDRKWSADGQNGAIDPDRTCDHLDVCRKIAYARPERVGT